MILFVDSVNIEQSRERMKLTNSRDKNMAAEYHERQNSCCAQSMRGSYVVDSEEKT